MAVFRLIDRHVLKEWLRTLALVICAMSGLLLLVSLYDVVPKLQEYEAPTSEAIHYFLVLSPSFLSFIVPISVLISLLYALGQLHRNNEITAMRAAGLSLFAITRWIWLAAALLSAGLFYLNSTVIPWSVEQSRLLLDNLRFQWEVRTTGSSEAVGLVKNVTYDNRTDGRVWLLSEFSEFSHRTFGVQVSEVDTQRREIRRIRAKEGFWDEVDQAWTFTDGRETSFDPQNGDPVRSAPFASRTYPDLREDPEWMLLLKERPKDLSFFELRRVIAAPETSDHPRRLEYLVRYHTLLAATFSCFIVTGIAIPFAVSGVRVNPAVGVSKAIGLFFLYYLLAETGKQFGEQGALVPTLAAWLPNLVMVGVAGLFVSRVR